MNKSFNKQKLSKILYLIFIAKSRFESELEEAKCPERRSLSKQMDNYDASIIWELSFYMDS